MLKMPASRYDEVHPPRDVCFEHLPQTARFGNGWVVQCSGGLPLIQTPRMPAPYGCVASSYPQGEGTRTKLALKIAVTDAGFLAWYQALERYVAGVVESKSKDWFGKDSAEVEPSFQDALSSCLAMEDTSPLAMLTLAVPTRAGEVLTHFYAADGSPMDHSKLEHGKAVACQIELEGLWFANQRWGLRWRLCSVKCYEDATPLGPAWDFAFVSDGEGDA